MRIISGKYKGRKIDGFSIQGTRPTMDRIRESLFAMIGSSIENAIVLDLFAGSGSLGFEALSEGASFCYFIDHNKVAIKTIEQNAKQLSCTENMNFLKMDAIEALKKLKQWKKTFNIIFLDPPYQMNLITPVINLIIDMHLLQDNGLIVCEFEDEKVVCSSLEIYKKKKYGAKNIVIYINKKS